MQEGFKACFDFPIPYLLTCVYLFDFVHTRDHYERIE